MTATVTPHLPFDHEYDCEVLVESNAPKIYFPRASPDSGGRDGLIVRIAPRAGVPWVGVFAFGDLRLKGVSGVFSTPDPEQLCIVARGNGYLVSARDPENWTTVDLFPVIDVRCVLEQRLIVFADLTELVAYDAKGVQWRTGRLTWDSMEVTNVSGNFLTGRFRDIRSDSMQTFIVDLKTGRARGGISGPHSQVGAATVMLHDNFDLLTELLGSKLHQTKQELERRTAERERES